METTHRTYFTRLAVFATALAGCQSQADFAGDISTLSTPEGTTMAATKIDNPETSSLDEQLQARATASAQTAPAERQQRFKTGIDLVRESGIEKTARQAGDAAIDGELIGWDGRTFRLSELWSEGPIILMWYRGGWCPYCNIQLRAMQQSLNSIESLGARLIVLTPELPEKAKETADANDIDLVALHDRDNRLAHEYGIMFDLPEPIAPIYRDQVKLHSYNGTDKLQLPLAATYVINRSGKITYAFLDADYKKRAEPSAVLAAVRAIAE
jgi:peroxiredoxin